MFSYIWPIALVVAANTFYQICAKSVPGNISPLAFLTVTYAVAAVASGVLYFTTTKDASLIREYSHINWTPFAMGLSVMGLEVGFIYAYKAGWPVSTASIVQSSFLAIALLVVGLLLYREQITWNKAVGVGICLVGLIFINK